MIAVLLIRDVANDRQRKVAEMACRESKSIELGLGVDALIVKDKLYIYSECSREDESHDLRVVVKDL